MSISLGEEIAGEVFKQPDIRLNKNQIEHLSKIKYGMSFPEVDDICHYANIRNSGWFFSILQGKQRDMNKQKQEEEHLKGLPKPRKLISMKTIKKEVSPTITPFSLYKYELVTIPEEPISEEPLVTKCADCKIVSTKPCMIYCRQCYETALDKIYKKELGIIK